MFNIPFRFKKSRKLASSVRVMAPKVHAWPLKFLVEHHGEAKTRAILIKETKWQKKVWSHCWTWARFVNAWKAKKAMKAMNAKKAMKGNEKPYYWRLTFQHMYSQ